MTGRGVRADAGASLVVVGEAGAGSGLCGCRGVGLESEFFDALEQLGVDRIGQRRRQLLRRGQVTALAAHTVDSCEQQIITIAVNAQAVFETAHAYSRPGGGKYQAMATHSRPPGATACVTDRNSFLIFI